MDGATRRSIKELTGEDPVDVLGTLEDYDIEDDCGEELDCDEIEALEAFEGDLAEGIL